MTFPDSPLIRILYWLINTPGLGGIIVSILGIGIVSSVGLMLRWIAKGASADNEPDAYAYPTPALHHHHRDNA